MSGPERITEYIDLHDEGRTIEVEYIRRDIHDEAVKALREIAKQKRTDELETEYDVEYADFEGGFDDCINRARAALAKIWEAV